MKLRPYQAQGIDFLADTVRAGLFDEPGLGKSMQSLLSMRDLVPHEPLLVVSPGDAIGVWQDECIKWLDEEPKVFAGLKPDAAMLDEALAADGIVITNYTRLATVLPAGRWGGIIFDESQMLRNRKTTTLFDAVKRQFGSAKNGLQRIPVFALSGTPIVKSTGDIWPMLHLFDRRTWSSYWRFMERYAIVWHDEYGWHAEGVQNVPRMWREISPWILRRTRTETQPELPPTIRQRVPVTMTPRQAKAYYALENDMIAELDPTNPRSALLLAPTALARESRLRAILVCPRLVGIEDDGAALAALREVAGSSTRPFVVFTAFPSAFSFIEAALAKTDRPVFKARGGMGSGFSESVKAFTASAEAGEPAILLASVHMGRGWSVSRVTYECYTLGADWNGVTQEQAEDRLRREGQTSTVFSRYFAHKNTVDYRVEEVWTGKLRLADVILDRYRDKAA